MKTLVTIILLLVVVQLKLSAQCGPGTPSFTVNLTGNPSGTWNSPFVIRNDNCCGTTNPDRCVKFVITLDPAAVGINFSIVDGAVPGGAMFYQINCGPPTAVGQPICLNGPGPHVLTFCKPGNNNNVYQIASIPGPTAGTNVTINDGCSGHISAVGYNPATVTWNSIFPGTPGQYNSYLSCTSNCLSPNVQAGASPPAFVDYRVCGQPAAMCNNGTTCDTVRVTFNPTLGVSIVPQNPTICFGQSSTSLTATGTGGTPPYSYLWNNVNPAQTINVGVGTYNVQLSDGSGCPPTFASVTVTQFSVAIDANAGPDQTRCIQSPVATLNGTVAGASGGVWSGGAGNFSPSNTTLTNMVYTPTAAEVASGSVNLILTTTGNGTCPPDRDTVKINFQPFIGTPTTTATDVSCTGGANGSATVSVTGGSFTPYTYSWNTVPAQTGATASNLAPGTYTVSITNAIGCVTQTSVTINQPAPLSLASTITNVSCNAGTNGSIAIAASGGTPGYTYSWAPGGQTSATATNLAAGIYTVTVRDSKNCTTTGTYTVTQPLILTASVNGTNVNCSGGSNGTATSTVSGGTTPYTYSWNPGGSTAANVTGLAAGNYTLTVTDNKTCVTTATIAITQPAPLVVSTTKTNETCDYLNNGTATAVVSGGTTNYTYSWQPGGQTTATIGSLASGTYTLTVTDARGCTGTAFATITQPTPLASTFINQTNVACFAGNTGSVTASASGGTPNYTYSWMPGAISGATASNLAAGTYTVTVTDNNTCQVQNTVTITQPSAPLGVSGVVSNVSCNAGNNGSITVTATGGTLPYNYLWSPTAQTTATAVSLAAGTYTVTVTDARGCTTSGTYTVTQPPVLTATLTPASVSCFGGNNGSITSSVAGGTIPYTYNWTPGNISTPTITGLAAGTYSVTITDNKGCVINNSATVTQPTVLFVTTGAVNETCSYLNNGSATATVTGGTANYTYSWMPGGQTSATASSLSSGTYTVTITDSKGCIASNTIAVTEPAVLTATFGSQTNVSCFGGSNGSVTAIASGGTPNYTYSWAPGAITGAMASGLSAGSYTLTVTDNHSCQVQNTVTITQPTQALSVAPSSTPASCFGSANGTVSASASGGTIPYASYVWQPGGISGATANGLAAGNYTVTATDANGCTATNTVAVTQPVAIVPVTSTVNSSCNQANGEASVSVTGGVFPYTYLWSPSGATTATATGLVSGPY
ncbi:MAG TPA: SprB repeat-containing protein, partial [Bacteroidia bacterium]